MMRSDNFGTKIFWRRTDDCYIGIRLVYVVQNLDADSVRNDTSNAVEFFNFLLVEKGRIEDAAFVFPAELDKVLEHEMALVEITFQVVE
jgi:hypothetical protein